MNKLVCLKDFKWKLQTGIKSYKLHQVLTDIPEVHSKDMVKFGYAMHHVHAEPIEHKMDDTIIDNKMMEPDCENKSFIKRMRGRPKKEG